MNYDALRAFFEQQIPFNRMLGIQVDFIERGRCRLRLPYRPELLGDASRPALHGGVLSTIADAAGGLAVFSTLDPMGPVSTVDLRVDYLRPGRAEVLFADAEIIRVGNRVAVANMTLHHGKVDERVADGRGVYNIVRRDSAP